MNIYNFMNQKFTAAKRGEKTGMNFPYIEKVIDIQKIMKKVYLN